MDLPAIYQFIHDQKFAVVSSLSPDSLPQSALVGIGVSPDLEIIFDTLSSTRKYRNLVARPATSLVIGWAGEQTVQFEGTAFLPEGDDLARYRAIYFETWPDGPARLSWPGLCHFVIKPFWLRYSDYNQNPPLIQEFNFAPE